MSEPTLYVPSLIEQLQACAADRRNLEEARAVMQAAIAKLRALHAELEPTLYTGVAIPKDGLASDTPAMRTAWQFLQRRVGDGPECQTCGGSEDGDHEPTDECGVVANLLHETRLLQHDLTSLRAELETTRQERDALLRDAGRGEGWQPIVTAPKDRTIIGALIRDGKVWRVHEMKHNGLAFYTVAGGSLPRMTHWMPLPAPPVADPPRPEET